MEFIQNLIESHNMPLLTAFLLGILTSISPCPLATNITAIAYISRDIKTVKNTVMHGLFYTLGRGISYTSLAILIYFGFSSFHISQVFQGWGDKLLGPLLIVVGLIMFGVIKIGIKGAPNSFVKAKKWLSKRGYLGSIGLGMLFALAFCPYSGVLYFGILIPLVLQSTEALLLPPLFALGTGLSVIVFAFLIAFSINKIGKVFGVMQKIEIVIRLAVASVFVIVGIYYTQYLIKYLLSYF
jgi:cytochrome c-type biogenesis protein